MADFSVPGPEVETGVAHAGLHPLRRTRRHAQVSLRHSLSAMDMPVTQPASFVPTWADAPSCCEGPEVFPLMEVSEREAVAFRQPTRRVVLWPGDITRITNCIDEKNILSLMSSSLSCEIQGDLTDIPEGRREHVNIDTTTCDPIVSMSEEKIGLKMRVFPQKQKTHRWDRSFGSKGPDQA